jgi:predicted Zn-dependent protease
MIALLGLQDTAYALCEFKSRSLLRDAEIESLLRIYTYPIFKAAGLNPSAVRVHLINSNTINAFVANGQRIFIHTGLLTRSKTPNIVIGVLAHETGHIAGAHLTRMQAQLRKAQTTAIISMLLGAAAAIGGAAAGGGGDMARAGSGIMLGGRSLALRNLLSYQRAQEAAADQAAVKYLSATGQSARGMIELFEELANQAVGTLRHVDPYVLSHPMPRDRISFLTDLARRSPHFKKKDSRALMFRHRMIQAKIHGYLESARMVSQRYPRSDTSAPARYARAISRSCLGDLRGALAELDHLQRAMPTNPFIYELRGQALFESGKFGPAVKALNQAIKLAPNNGLMRIFLGQVLIATGSKKNIDLAIGHLNRAGRWEPRSSMRHLQLSRAYGQKGLTARAAVYAAEASFFSGDVKSAKQIIKRAKPFFRKGSPEWRRANEILRYKKVK